jgi:hypothetical protein
MAFGVSALDDEVLALYVAERDKAFEQRVIEALVAMGKKAHAPDLA